LAAGLESVGGEGGFLDVKDNEVPLANHYKLPRLRQVLSRLRIVHIRSSDCSFAGPKNAAFKQNRPLEGNSGTALLTGLAGMILMQKQPNQQEPFTVAKRPRENELGASQQGFG
jgi:hypothetical protein